MELHENNLAEVPVKTPNGIQAGTISFVPCDAGIFKRIADTQEQFAALLEIVKLCDITPDGKGKNAVSAVFVEDFNTQFAQLVDYACGVVCSAQAFEKYAPLAAMSDGSFWATCVMDALGEVVTTIGANIRDFQKTMKKWK